MFTRLDYSSALEYSIIRRYTNIVYYYYYYYYYYYKEGTTVYMETEHEMSNILTSDNRTTTEMQMV